MAHIKLQHVVRAMPHGAGLRKRKGRRLKPVKPSYSNELWYKGQLLAVVSQLRRVARDDLLPELKRMEPLYAKAVDGFARDRGPRPAGDLIGDRVAAMKRQFGGIDGVAKRLADAATKRNLDAVDKRLAASVKTSVGMDISGFISHSGPIQQVVSAATKANVSLIKSIPEQYFEKLQVALEKNMEAGLRFEDLAKEIERIADVTESRAKLIARDQTSKMNGAMNQVRQTSLGINSYVWQTAGDERVREEHQANDGQTFDWDKPPETGHPGDDINCRCVAIPVFNLEEDDPGISLGQAVSLAGSVASVGYFLGEVGSEAL